MVAELGALHSAHRLPVSTLMGWKKQRITLMTTLIFWTSTILEFFLWLALIKYVFSTFGGIVEKRLSERQLWVRSLICLLLFYGAFVACPLVRHSPAFQAALTHVQPDSE